MDCDKGRVCVDVEGESVGDEVETIVFAAEADKSRVDMEDEDGSLGEGFFGEGGEGKNEESVTVDIFAPVELTVQRMIVSGTVGTWIGVNW